MTISNGGSGNSGRREALASREVGIKAIAEALRLSASTVSRALNGVPGVNPETRKLVEKTAKEMGYVPNMGAQQLVGKRSNLIGVYVPEFEHDNMSFGDMFSSIQKSIQKYGKDVIFYFVPLVVYEGQRLIESVQSRNLEGCVLFPAFDEHHPLTREALRIQVPCVNFEGVLGPHCSSVLSDDTEGGRIAGRRLLEAGHRVIGYINGPSHLRICKQRYQGFVEALAEYGIIHPASLVAEGNFTAASGEAALMKLREAHPEMTAVFGANDLMATGAISNLQKGGLRVPEDFSVIGYDDDLLAKFINPPLTTIRHGQSSVVPLLNELFEGKPGRLVMAKPELVERQTVADRRTRD
ncbi:LacI family DNA-binding transcriptional regulator [Cohnella panacarvi]|uniref:LacI family DNA-binding transcriptional regulator n=1 Tax=Cohnella panacarvi TaxID=400776 RepID=UPI00047D4068|nr:LacI family DNA-binding transcriptional regulator [Cohnella panacarvi]